jgi:decaprenyl-phosphate phosphoribosyltransferase
MSTAEAVAHENAPDTRGWVGVDLLRLVRPLQWWKNILVVPLALAAGLGSTTGTVLRMGWAVAVFCVASSLVYVINDIADHRLDRDHPVKRWRPIASGRISPAAARAYAVAIAVVLLAAMLAGPAMSWWPLVAYVGLNLGYSRWFKHVPLLDICVVAAGFGVRVLQGHEATGGPVSSWLLVAVLTGCLVLVVGKRRHELQTAGATHRPALRGYNVALTDHLLAVNAILAVLTFLLYLGFDAPVGDHRDVLLVVAAPLALFGVFRYLQAVLVRRHGDDPVRALLHDRLIVADAVLLAMALLTAMFIASNP